MESSELNQLNGESLLHGIEYKISEQEVVKVKIVDKTASASFFDCVEFEVFTVTGYNSDIESPDDIEIWEGDQVFLGLLCLACKDSTMQVDNMTLPRYVSYIMDCVSPQSVGVDKSHTFKNSYLLIDCERAAHYKKKYMNSAPLWGGFTHAKKSPSPQKKPNKLFVREGLVFPTAEHQSKLDNAVHSQDGFDRFLKKYHLLELIYDYICVLKLRTMDADIKDFRTVMSAYSKDEITSLKSLLTDYVIVVDEVIEVLHRATAYEAVIVQIFQTNSKSSNPFNAPDKWAVFWSQLNAQLLSFENAKAATKKIGKITNREEHRVLILNLVAYWIYRIRCSIAHSKIGEFIFKPEDESFVTEIAEALIDIIIAGVYSNPELKALITKSAGIDKCLSELV